MTLVQKNLHENTDIRQIEVEDAWQVTVIKDTLSTFVELEYSAYLEDYVSVEMNNNCLKVNFNKSVYTQSGSIFKAVVHTDKIEDLKVSDASKVTFEGGQFSASSDSLIIHLGDKSVCSGLDYSGHECKIIIDEASHFLDFHLSGYNCEVEVKDASSCKGSFDMSFHLVAELGDDSQFVTFGGSSPYGMIKLRDASVLNMVQTEIEEMHVDISSASEASVNVSNRLEGSVKEFSTLYYKGNPRKDVECDADSSVIPL